jgi:hypothetical protein
MISKFIFHFFSFQFIKYKKTAISVAMAQQVFWEEFHSKYFNSAKEV